MFFESQVQIYSDIVARMELVRNTYKEKFFVVFAIGHSYSHTAAHTHSRVYR